MQIDHPFGGVDPKPPNPRPSAWQGQQARRGGDTSREPLTLRVPDPDARWRAVRVATDVPLPTRELERRNGDWVLELPPLRLDRVEYVLELEHPDGGTKTIADPTHDTLAPGAFGSKSVLEAADYAPPAWLHADVPRGRIARVGLGRIMRRRLETEVWTPEGLDGPAPVLLAHDGPEFDSLAGLTRWAAVMVDRGRLPPFRLVLLPPGDRDNWYSASEGYARAFATQLLPALRRHVPVEGPVAGMGASLGALAMLHVHRRHPATLAGCSSSPARTSPRRPTRRSPVSAASPASPRSSAGSCARAPTSTPSRWS